MPRPSKSQSGPAQVSFVNSHSSKVGGIELQSLIFCNNLNFSMLLTRGNEGLRENRFNMIKSNLLGSFNSLYLISSLIKRCT